MNYEIEFKDLALVHLKKLKKSGKKKDIERINRFIVEIKIHPREGIGKPKHLKHHQGEVWSRKINDKDRFVYRIFE